MAFVVGVLLAFFVFDPPLSYLVVAGGAVVEIGESGAMLWWSRRRRTRVGIETLIGLRATAVHACRPEGQVRVQGEIWSARCAEGVDAGEEVRVDGFDGLVLIVRRVG
jgi:membrane-bound serine protease (ClpP class)